MYNFKLYCLEFNGMDPNTSGILHWGALGGFPEGARLSFVLINA